MAHHVEVQQLLMRADNIMLCAQAGAGRSQSTQENVQTYGVIVIAFYRGHKLHAFRTGLLGRFSFLVI